MSTKDHHRHVTDRDLERSRDCGSDKHGERKKHHKHHHDHKNYRHVDRTFKRHNHRNSSKDEDVHRSKLRKIEEQSVVSDDIPSEVTTIDDFDKHVGSSSEIVTETVATAENDFPSPACSDRLESSVVSVTTVSGVNKHAFFKNLIAAEANKPIIGTLHANAARMEKIVEKEAIKNSLGEWECTKCGAKNVKYNMQCDKCRALRRMSLN